jgi:D-alanine-D-alanine ligase
LGNKRLSVLPIREVYFDNTENNGPVMATYRVKWNKKYQKKWNIRFDYAELDEPTMSRISRVCKKVYRLLHLHDYGRIDMRLTPEKKIYILEANSNPDLHCFDEVANSAKKVNISYPELINRILNLALNRHRSSH